MFPSTQKIIENSGRAEVEAAAPRMEPTAEREAVLEFLRPAGGAAFVLDGSYRPQIERGVVTPTLPIRGKGWSVIDGPAHADSLDYVAELGAIFREIAPFARFIAAPRIGVQDDAGKWQEVDSAFIETAATVPGYSYPVSLMTVFLSTSLPAERAELEFFATLWRLLEFEAAMAWNGWDEGFVRVVEPWVAKIEASLETHSGSDLKPGMKRADRRADAFARFAIGCGVSGAIPNIEWMADGTPPAPHTVAFVEAYIGELGERIDRSRCWAYSGTELNLSILRNLAARDKAEKAGREAARKNS